MFLLNMLNFGKLSNKGNKMKIGIIPNITKVNTLKIINDIIEKLENNKLEYYLSNVLNKFKANLILNSCENRFQDENYICEKSDIIFSIGGDGTFLSTAFKAKDYGTPIAGINNGKMGFLAEFSIDKLDELFLDIVNKNYILSQRLALESKCITNENKKYYAINDIVIDKGGWPKMIEITVFIDDNYVSSFVADGLIIATPTGSTGYSISTGGPIVYPHSEVITLTPIAPHTLTIRPIVLSSNQIIRLGIKSQHNVVQINCDGQRVDHIKPPFKLEIKKSAKSLKIIQPNNSNYFDILRKKLLWGYDTRLNDSIDN